MYVGVQSHFSVIVMTLGFIILSGAHSGVVLSLCIKLAQVIMSKNNAMHNAYSDFMINTSLICFLGCKCIVRSLYEPNTYFLIYPSQYIFHFLFLLCPLFAASISPTNFSHLSFLDVVLIIVFWHWRIVHSQFLIRHFRRDKKNNLVTHSCNIIPLALISYCVEFDNSFQVQSGND